MVLRYTNIYDILKDQFITYHFTELQIPPNANVYYAINTQHDLNFVLRPRGDISKDREKEAELFKTSATPARSKRDTSKARRKLLGLAL